MEIDDENDNSLSGFQSSTNGLLDAVMTICQTLQGSNLSEDALKKCDISLGLIEDFFGVSDIQAILLCLMVHQTISANSCNNADLIRFLDISPILLLELSPNIDVLIKQKFIKTDSRDKFKKYNTYYVMSHVMTSLVTGVVKEPPIDFYDDISFVNWAFNLIEACNDNYDSALDNALAEIDIAFEEQKLPVINAINDLKLDNVCEKVMLIGFVYSYLENGVFYQNCERAFGNVYPSQYSKEKLEIKKQIVSGSYRLIKEGIIEVEKKVIGYSEPYMLSLSEKGAKLLLGNNNDVIIKKKAVSSDLVTIVTPDTIQEKRLFYNPQEAESVKKLYDYLNEKNFNRICAKLNKNGLKPSIVILLSGYSGTGKTELVNQLARHLNKVIIFADTAKIRSCWVGEQDKHIRTLFNSVYPSAISYYGHVPLLCFNESDSLFNVRINSKTATDISFNSSQNLLMEELERFGSKEGGICILTSNYSIEKMDSAFFRRILFRINFTKPQKTVREKILHDKFPTLKKSEIQYLADFEITGAGVENVLKKIMLDSALNDKTNIFERVKKYCAQEVYTKNGEDKSQMGFKI